MGIGTIILIAIIAVVVLLALKSLEEITDDFVLDISYMDIILN